MDYYAAESEKKRKRMIIIIIILYIAIESDASTIHQDISGIYTGIK